MSRGISKAIGRCCDWFCGGIVNCFEPPLSRLATLWKQYYARNKKSLGVDTWGTPAILGSLAGLVIGSVGGNLASKTLEERVDRTQMGMSVSTPLGAGVGFFIATRGTSGLAAILQSGAHGIYDIASKWERFETWYEKLDRRLTKEHTTSQILSGTVGFFCGKEFFPPVCDYMFPFGQQQPGFWPWLGRQAGLSNATGAMFMGVFLGLICVSPVQKTLTFVFTALAAIANGLISTCTDDKYYKTMRRTFIEERQVIITSKLSAAKLSLDLAKSAYDELIAARNSPALVEQLQGMMREGNDYYDSAETQTRYANTHLARHLYSYARNNQNSALEYAGFALEKAMFILGEIAKDRAAKMESPSNAGYLQMHP